jgi:hypothetical protein
VVVAAAGPLTFERNLYYGTATRNRPEPAVRRPSLSRVRFTFGDWPEQRFAAMLVPALLFTARVWTVSVPPGLRS